MDDRDIELLLARQTGAVEKEPGREQSDAHVQRGAAEAGTEEAAAEARLRRLEELRNQVGQKVEQVEKASVEKKTGQNPGQIEELDFSNPNVLQEVMHGGAESKKGEVTAKTVGRLLGLATVGELKLLEAKLDLMSTRLSTTLSKIDKFMGQLSKLPTGSDHERLEVQIASLRSQIQQVLAAVTSDKEDVEKS